MREEATNYGPEPTYMVVPPDSESPKERQVGGDHYCKLKIQPVDFIMANGLNFCAGNVVKYICRYPSKNGKGDLLKARHYIDLLIESEYPEHDTK